MSRSAADATRFTATGPYASSKPGAAAPRAAAPYKLPGFLSGSANNNKKSKQSAPQGQGDGPGGKQETPREKVERLRAQARAARVAQSTSHVDRLIDVGRRFANRAHKVMVYTLIAASGMFLQVLGIPTGTGPLNFERLSCGRIISYQFKTC